MRDQRGERMYESRFEPEQKPDKITSYIKCACSISQTRSRTQKRFWCQSLIGLLMLESASPSFHLLPLAAAVYGTCLLCCQHAVTLENRSRDWRLRWRVKSSCVVVFFSTHMQKHTWCEPLIKALASEHPHNQEWSNGETDFRFPCWHFKKRSITSQVTLQDPFNAWGVKYAFPPVAATRIDQWTNNWLIQQLLAKLQRLLDYSTVNRLNLSI